MLKIISFYLYFILGLLETANNGQENGSLGNSPPLPNGPAPLQPPPPQFDSDDLDKLPPLPPGSPPPVPGICDVPLRNLNFLITYVISYASTIMFWVY